MCCPSLNRIVLEKEINLEAASPNVLQSALWRAYSEDMPLGVRYLSQLALEVRQTGNRIVRQEEQNSALGRELSLLLGAGVAREVCEARLDVAFGLYNSCIPVAAPDAASLNMNPLEQIQLEQQSAEKSFRPQIPAFDHVPALAA